MSITSFISSVCTQDVIYWEYDGVNREGQASFKDPVDRKCRWDEETQIVSDAQGDEFTSDAQLLVPENMIEQSFVMLGTVADLPVDDSPQNQDDAFEVKRMSRYPLYKGTEFKVFQAFLGRR